MNERIAKYHARIAEADQQQRDDDHYRGAEYAAAVGIIRAALIVAPSDADAVAQIAAALARWTR